MDSLGLEIDEKGLIGFARQLIRTPSLSMQEEAVALIISQKMREVGFQNVKIDPIFNVFGFLKGESNEIELMFNGHIDHVPPGEMNDPYSGSIVNGAKYGISGPVILGRGACDMKGSIASMIYGAKYIVDSGIPLKKTFILTAVVREEMGKGEGILSCTSSDPLGQVLHFVNRHSP